MKFKELKKSLITKIENCYLLSCKNDAEDLFLKSSCKNNIISACLKDYVDLNLTVFETENLNLDAFKKALNTMPFMADKKVVLLKETTLKKNDALMKLINEYLENSNDFTVLIIDACEGSNFKDLEKNEKAVIVDCSRLDRDLIVSFALKACKDAGLTITPGAINKLIDFCDGYMIKVNLELNKLISFKQDEKEITEKDIDINVNKSEEYQIFELTNALFNKQGDKALFIVDDIIKNKKNTNSILPLIYNHIRRLFYIKISKESLTETAKMLEIKEFAVKKLKEETNFVSAKKLKTMVNLCKDIDFKIKSGSLDIISGIYNLVFTILV